MTPGPHPLLMLLAILVIFDDVVKPSSTTKSPPHIVFILADDYGWADVGYHGSDIRTPNLDALASQGVKLENYYVQPICSPTRSQLMTGRYQIHTGLQHYVILANQPNCLPDDSFMLPRQLQLRNYSTHLVGKWHLGFYRNSCQPLQKGFESAFGYWGGMEDYWTHQRGPPVYQIPDEQSHWMGLDFRDNDRPAWEYGGNYSTFVFTERAQRIISSHDAQKPLFLYLPFQAVHSPLQVPSAYEEPYAYINDSDRRTYAGMVTCMDEGIGRIVATLRQTGLWNNTLLIFSTDNGGRPATGGYNWPLRGVKNTLWEGGVRGIGFLAGPGVLPVNVQGTINRQLMHVSDWFPTLVEGVAGGNITGIPLDGFNQWKTIIQLKVPSPRKELLHNIDPLITTQPLQEGADPEVPATFTTEIRAGIRVGDWKLLTGFPGSGVWFPPPEYNLIPYFPVVTNQTVWLFNIKDDPYEWNDLSLAQPSIVALLVNKLKMYYKEMVPVRFPNGTAAANPALHYGVWDSWQ